MFGLSPPDLSRYFDGKQKQESTTLKKSELQKKLKHYNKGLGNAQKLKGKESNGDLIIDGVLRIYWGVIHPIYFQPKDEEKPATPVSHRKSYIMAINNGLTSEESSQDNGRLKLHRTQSVDEKSLSLPAKRALLRKRSGNKRDRTRRLSIINGHTYDLDTSVFTPTHGSVTSVRVSSLENTGDVIRSLLNKFKIMNPFEDFCLCVVYSSGVTKVLGDDDYPLIERVMQGPMEDNAKLYIMDRDGSENISEEVASYMSLPYPVLMGFLEKYQQEQDADIQLLHARYDSYKNVLKDYIGRLEKSANSDTSVA